MKRERPRARRPAATGDPGGHRGPARYTGIPGVGAAKKLLCEALHGGGKSITGDDVFNLLDAIEQRLHAQLDRLCLAIGKP